MNLLGMFRRTVKAGTKTVRRTVHFGANTVRRIGRVTTKTLGMNKRRHRRHSRSTRRSSRR